MKFDAFFFDLDGTLYNSDNGLIENIDHRLDEWILKTVPMPEDEVLSFRHRLFSRYGGTLPGLTIEYGSDFFASLRYCHDVPVDRYIFPNPALRDVLQRLPGRKYVFTSAYRCYAKRVLDALGVSECFEGIIDAIDVFPKPKPFPEAFQRAFQISGEADIRRCVFLDDQPRNVEAGHREGFFSVQVSSSHPRSESADGYIERIEDLMMIPEFQTKGSF